MGGEGAGLGNGGRHRAALQRPSALEDLQALGWRGAERQRHLHREAGAGPRVGGGRAKLSFDPDTLPSVLCIKYFSFQIFAIFLNTTYISNSLNVQSDCESNPVHCKTSRIL